MVNTQLIDAKIDSSGLKINHIVENLGISRAAFYKKKNNDIPFRKAEVFVLCSLLNITDDSERDHIFFVNEVEQNVN